LESIENEEELKEKLKRVHEENKNVETSNLNKDDRYFVNTLSNVASFANLTEYELESIINDFIPNNGVNIIPYIRHREVIVEVSISLKTYIGFKLDKEFRLSIFNSIKQIISKRKSLSISVYIKIKFLRLFGWSIGI